MAKIKTSRFRSYIVAQMVLASISALMLVFMDFGGYYYRDGYNHIDVWGYVYFGSGVVPTALVFLGVGGLAVAFSNAMRILKKKEISVKEIKGRLRIIRHGAIFTAVLAGVGALVLILTSLDTDWWLDGGFYGPFLGSLLVAFVTKLMGEHIK